MKISQIKSLKRLPTHVDLGAESINDSVVFFDQKLLKYSFFKQWLSVFPSKIALNAGEELKTLKTYEKNLHLLLKMPILLILFFSTQR